MYNKFMSVYEYNVHMPIEKPDSYPEELEVLLHVNKVHLSLYETDLISIFLQIETFTFKEALKFSPHHSGRSDQSFVFIESYCIYKVTY